MNISRLLVLIALLPIANFAHSAATCYVGYDSRKCLAQRAAAQDQLNELYGAEEQAIVEKLKGYEGDYVAEAIQQWKKTNKAMEEYKDSACYSDQLRDGMSFKDAGVLADACRVEWRERAIEALCLSANPSFHRTCAKSRAGR